MVKLRLTTCKLFVADIFDFFRYLFCVDFRLRIRNIEIYHQTARMQLATIKCLIGRITLQKGALLRGTGELPPFQ